MPGIKPTLTSLPVELLSQVLEQPELSAQDVKHVTETNSSLFRNEHLMPHRRSAQVTLKAPSVRTRQALTRLRQPNDPKEPSLQDLANPSLRLRPLAKMAAAVSIFRSIGERPADEQHDAFNDLRGDVALIVDHSVRARALVPLARAYPSLDPGLLNQTAADLRQDLRALEPKALGVPALTILIAGLDRHAPEDRIHNFDEHHKQIKELDPAHQFQPFQELLRQFDYMLNSGVVDFTALQAQFQGLCETLLGIVPEAEGLLAAGHTEFGVLSLARHGRPALQLTIDHWNEFEAIGFRPRHLEDIMVADNADVAMQAIAERLPALTAAGFTSGQLVRLANEQRRDAGQLPAVIDLGLQLIQHDFTAEQIVAIGEQNPFGVEALRALVAKLPKLLQHGFTIDQLVQIGSGSQWDAEALVQLINHVDDLMAARFTPDLFAWMATDSKTFLFQSMPILTRHHKALINFGFTPEVLCRIAALERSTGPLAFIAENLAALKSHGHDDPNEIAAVCHREFAMRDLTRMAAGTL
jgi:hypothetical protein